MGLTKTKYTCSANEVYYYYTREYDGHAAGDEVENSHGAGAGYYLGKQTILRGPLTMTRIAITTDTKGCTSLKFAVSGAIFTTRAGEIRWMISAEPLTLVSWVEGHYQSYTKSWGDASNFTVSPANVTLLPNTTYYVYILACPASGYESIANGWAGPITFTASGDARNMTPATPYGVMLRNRSTGTDTLRFGDTLDLSYFSDGVDGVTFSIAASVALPGGQTREVSFYTRIGSLAPSIVFPLSVYGPLLPEQAETSFTLTITAYHGNTAAGSFSQAYGITFPEIPPTVTSGGMTLEIYNTGAVSGFSGAIEGYSRIRAGYDSSRISAQYGASIVKWTVSIDDRADTDLMPTLSSFVSGTVSRQATSAALIVTDSRGFTVRETMSLSVIPYVNPAVSAAAYRCQAAADTEDDEGTRLAITPSGTIASVNGQNSIVSITLQWRYAGSGDSGWVSKGSLTNGVKSFFTNLEDRTYDLRVTLTDALGNTAVWEGVIASAKWAMKFMQDNSGVAFGKAAEFSNQLQIPDAWRFASGLYPVPDSNPNHALTTAQQRQTQANIGLIALKFTGVTVAAADWTDTQDGSNYPWRAAVNLSAVTANMVPVVFYSKADAESGDFSPTAVSYAGGVYLYAAAQPASAVTVPVILVWGVST